MTPLWKLSRVLLTDVTVTPITACAVSVLGDDEWIWDICQQPPSACWILMPQSTHFRFYYSPMIRTVLSLASCLARQSNIQITVSETESVNFQFYCTHYSILHTPLKRWLIRVWGALKGKSPLWQCTVNFAREFKTVSTFAYFCNRWVRAKWSKQAGQARSKDRIEGCCGLITVCKAEHDSHLIISDWWIYKDSCRNIL